MKSSKKSLKGTKNIPYPDQAAKLLELRGPKTQKQLAAELGIGLRTYSRYELGTREVPNGLIRLGVFLAGQGHLYNKDRVAPSGETADLLRMTREVLESNTEYSASLAANIRSFHRAVMIEHAKKPEVNIEDRLARLEEACDEIVGEVKAIKRTVSKVSSEGSGGGDIENTSSGSLAA